MQDHTAFTQELTRQLEEKQLFEQAKAYAFDYFSRVDGMRAVPARENLAALARFDEPLPQEMQDAAETLEIGRAHV